MKQAGPPARISIPPYPLQNSPTAKLRKLAQQSGDSGYTSFWAGQSGAKTGWTQAREVIKDLIEQYEELHR